MPCAYRSRSQWADDIRLLPMLACAAGAPATKYSAADKAPHPVPPSGSFVELGAFDGLSNSNTFMIERCYSWRGLLIEASPANYKLLLSTSNRSAYKVHSAVCAAPGGYIEVSAEGDQMGGEVGLIPTETMRKFNHRLKLSTSVAKVPCAPLGELMDRAGLPTEVTFLSLDVEGAEVKVLSTIDPARFQIVLVETNTPGFSRAADAKNAHVDAILTRAGMLRVPRLGNRVNHAYVRRDVLERCGHAVNRTCTHIYEAYQLPRMDCHRHHNFQDLHVAHG
jgi:FkbM family methyltransferase